MIDCDTSNNGCDGGYGYRAMLYVKEVGQITNSDYPYTSGNGKAGTCQAASFNPAVKVTNVVRVPPLSHLDLLAAISQGPVKVRV